MTSFSHRHEGNECSLKEIVDHKTAPSPYKRFLSLQPEYAKETNVSNLFQSRPVSQRPTFP